MVNTAEEENADCIYYEADNFTEDEIIIEYNGQTEIFERLSSSVVQNEDRIQYEYFGPPEE